MSEIESPNRSFRSEDSQYFYHYVTSGNIAFGNEVDFFHPKLDEQKTQFDRFLKMAQQGLAEQKFPENENS